ncbi:hypothetical protein FRC11_012756 [Ceratobasidium sp. 423]|nr:hypothetical protein FRC11_012756 [Ceratobasidium sp. 423]
MHTQLTNVATYGPKPPPTSQLRRRVLVMGLTGAGKSTFINLVAGSMLTVGASIHSCTQISSHVSFPLEDGTVVEVLDTPGFDDSTRSEFEVLENVVHALQSWAPEGVHAIIYIHRISDYKMPGSAIRAFDTFSKMCGSTVAVMTRVAIVTNMWGVVSSALGEEREAELGNNDALPFKNALKLDAKLYRNNNPPQSAIEIVRTLQELAGGIPLLRTMAGEAISLKMARRRAEYEAEVKSLNQQYVKALQDYDVETREEIEEERKLTERKLEELKRIEARLREQMEQEAYQANRGQVEQVTYGVRGNSPDSNKHSTKQNDWIMIKFLFWVIGLFKGGRTFSFSIFFSLIAQLETPAITTARGRMVPPEAQGALSDLSTPFCGDLTRGGEVALKQSRVSKRIRRPLLEHEARVLKLLVGHPAIPQVYGYGRIEHFELISMQLLDKSLGDTVDTEGPLPIPIVFGVASQLISALKHIHSWCLVHRDIKPDNILIQRSGSWQICLIDFGLSYPAPSAIEVAESRSSDHSEPATVFGTLPYASLNAHEGLKLTYRDDLESLAYTFLFLLRGNLPWSHYTQHGTTHGRIRQVHEQKKELRGSQLAAGLPEEFGELVDYARSLSAGELPSYRYWQEKLNGTAEAFTNNASYHRAQPPPSTQGITLGCQPPPPVEPGHIVLIKLISPITAEGYSIQAGHERSYIRDPCFDKPEWNTPPRPGVILEVEWDDQVKIYRFTAAAISDHHEELERSSNLKVPIVGSNLSLFNSPQAIVLTDWPFKLSYCYAFKWLTKFHCLPSQGTVSSNWKIDLAGVKTFITSLTPPRNPNPFASLHDSESSDPDTRHDAKMRTGYVKLYAQVSQLTLAETTCASVDWKSTRGWFDECVKASRYYDMCNGDLWTQASDTQINEGSEEDVSDSYYEDDFEEWEPQQERDRSITLRAALEGKDGRLADVFEVLDEIELVD